MYQREFERKLRIGIVGAGSHTYRNLLPALHFLPMELVAICNRGEEKLSRTTAEYRCPGYATTREMYEKERLDAVILSVSPQMHPPLAIEALSYGLHVFMEKPPAMRAEEVRAVMRAQGDRVVSVGFKKAFMPAAVKAREIAASAKYGNLQSILAVYPMALPADGAGVLARGEFTNWLGNGCHPLSLMMSVAGPVDAVTAITGGNGHGALVLAFENGITGTLQLASGPLPVERYTLFGRDWNLAIENGDTVRLNRGIPFEYAYTDNFAPAGDESGEVVWRPQNTLATLENKALFVQGMVQEMDCFARAVLDGGDVGFGGLPFALSVMKVYEAALLSRGQRIGIDKEPGA